MGENNPRFGFFTDFSDIYAYRNDNTERIGPQDECQKTVESLSDLHKRLQRFSRNMYNGDHCSDIMHEIVKVHSFDINLVVQFI